MFSYLSSRSAQGCVRRHISGLAEYLPDNVHEITAEAPVKATATLVDRIFSTICRLCDFRW